MRRSRLDAPSPQRESLAFDNGIGGFSPDGREYVIAPAAGQRPPAPWVNVLANPRFDTVISEPGSAYTWCENAHELRLTPWRNDPVTDAGGDVIYLRDEESGEVWHPTSLPAGPLTGEYTGRSPEGIAGRLGSGPALGPGPSTNDSRGERDAASHAAPSHVTRHGFGYSVF